MSIRARVGGKSWSGFSLRRPRTRKACGLNEELSPRLWLPKDSAEILALAHELIQARSSRFVANEIVSNHRPIMDAVTPSEVAELGQDVKDWGDVDSLPASLRVQPGARAAFRTVWFGVGRGPRIGVGV